MCVMAWKMWIGFGVVLGLVGNGEIKIVRFDVD